MKHFIAAALATATLMACGTSMVKSDVSAEISQSDALHSEVEKYCHSIMHEHFPSLEDGTAQYMMGMFACIGNVYTKMAEIVEQRLNGPEQEPEQEQERPRGRWDGPKFRSL